MARPQFPNLDRLAHGCINLRKDSMTVNAQDAKGIANDYTRLLEYVTELQDTIIELQKTQNTVVEVQLDGDTF
jgi:DNA polymerase III gamma/tau subunit|tara:strand:- start:575 stop:793 length:219 start_codon:yes stop_codon:yes gene_type:complete